MKKTLLALAVALSMPMATAQAQNQTCGLPDFDAMAFNWGANITYLDACVGAFGPGNEGNDSQDETFAGKLNDWFDAQLADDQAFTSLDNSLWEKYDNGPSNPIDISGMGIDDGDIFAAVLKQGSFFSVYLFGATGDVTNFSWNTSGVNANGGTGDGELSHSTIWRIAGDGGDVDCLPGEECNEVPEPASFGLVFAGLAGLGAVARRRRNRA